LEELIAREGVLLTRRRVEEAGLDPYILTRWLRRGRLERLQRGVYRAVGAGPGLHEVQLEVQLRIPYGVICLASALAFHGLTKYIPDAVHIAVPRDRKPPRLENPPLEVFFFSPKTYDFGIEAYPIGGQELRVYSPEKTLADMLCFKSHFYSLFLEGLSNYFSRPNLDLPKLNQAAKLRRVAGELSTLTEALYSLLQVYPGNQTKEDRLD
ncbi:MAG: type IV toxin-antitoxin system AbiEi family antitoxin domain-containing protein, partial [Meiothermus sp.]|nr:type IV toxin-antitoxin system AbiEi family antitoxin domain-containing protein [Meiothermus sp.]